MPRRRQPEKTLGGSFVRGPDGYRWIVQYWRPYPSNIGMQQLYSNASQKRYPPKWDGLEPEGAVINRFTDPISLSCSRCGAPFGPFAAYHSGVEYGIVRHTAREYVPLGNFPPGELAKDRRRRFLPKHPIYTAWGEIGHRASRSQALFDCSKCGNHYERNMAKFGRLLFQSRPATFAVE